MDDIDTTRRTLFRALLAGAGAALVSAPARTADILRRSLPRGGETLPAVGLGTWQSFDVAAMPDGLAAAGEALRTLVSGGGRVVDSSPMYGSSEAVVGELAAALGITRELFIATKVWTRGRTEGIAQMEESLRRLRVERIDLMQVHNLVDAATHLATLAQWQRAGRVRHVGVTHYQASAHHELERIIAGGGVDFLQVNYSLAEPEAERRLLRRAADLGVAVIVNRPFAEGALFARVRNRPLPDWAAELGCDSWAQCFLKWILAHPAVTCVIPGSRNPRHVAENLAAARAPLPDAALRSRMARLVAGL